MTHSKLIKDDHLVEVLFELRYGSDKLTDDFVGKFHDSLRESYPYREDMAAQFVKFEMRPEQGGWKTITSKDSENDPLDIVRYRFKNADSNRLCQLGNGILSINFLKYESIDIFVGEVARIVEAHNRVFAPQSYRRVGLRYINHFPHGQDRNPINLLSWSARLPKDKRHEVVSNVQQTLLNMGDTGFQSIVVAYPQMNQTQQRIILLDIESFLHFQQPVEPNLEVLGNWMREANEEIWKSFIGALTPSFFKELQYGSNTKAN
jgi:uncharacterized protein (TIGR04255 family)